MMNIPKTKAEYLLYAMRHYDGNSISVKEFKSDLRTFGKIEKQINKFINGDEGANTRLLVNLFVIAFNQFGNGAFGLILGRLKTQHEKDIACMVFEFLHRENDLVAMTKVNTDEHFLQKLLEI